MGGGGEQPQGLGCGHDPGTLLPKMAGGTAIQDVEAAFGVGRLPGPQVPRCGTLPAPRDDRLPVADPSGVTAARCQSRDQRTKRASTAQRAGSAATPPASPLAGGRRFLRPLPTLPRLRPQTGVYHDVLSAFVVYGFSNGH